MKLNKNKKGAKWAFVDEEKREICDYLYDEVRDFREGFAAVRIDDKWGFINEGGKEICEIRYDEVVDFQSKLAAVRKEGRMCYIDCDGNEVAVTNFMDEEMIFDGCKSCAIGNHTITNVPAGYLYDDGFVNLTIDPEVPIKGFLVLGITKHISSTTSLTKKERMQIEEISNKAKEALEYFGVEHILVFEDGFSEHYRKWIIATEEWMFQFGRGKNLKQITMYAKKNATMEYKQEILDFAEKIKEYFKEK